jgi:hypothetical protein
MRRFLVGLGCSVVVVAAALAGCGSGNSSNGAAGSGGASGGSGGGAGGTGQDGGGGSGGVPSPFEQFAKLADAATGVAFGKDNNGDTVLYVSLGASDQVVKVTAQGAVGTVASVPAAAGIALEANGDLLVCGHAPGGTNGVLWNVKPDGSKTSFVTDSTFDTLLAVAVAPDDRVVFSDATKVYGVDSAGSVGSIIIITGQATDPTALAFSKDGTELYVGSGDTGDISSVPRSPAIGNYSNNVTKLSSGLGGLSALVVLESTDLVALSSGGVYQMKRDGSGRTNLASPAGLTAPVGAARGIDNFGDYLYLGNGKSVVRLPFSDVALSLPVR